jgi:hypothetical protein
LRAHRSAKARGPRPAAEQLFHGVRPETGGVGAHEGEALRDDVGECPGRSAGEPGPHGLGRCDRRPDLDAAADRPGDDHDVAHPGGLGGGDDGGGVTGADPLCEQEGAVDVREGGSECRWSTQVAQVAQVAHGPLGQSCGVGRGPDEET